MRLLCRLVSQQESETDHRVGISGIGHLLIGYLCALYVALLMEERSDMD
jgi:hypothetical protein